MKEPNNKNVVNSLFTMAMMVWVIYLIILGFIYIVRLF